MRTTDLFGVKRARWSSIPNARSDVEHQPGEANPPADSSPDGKIRWTAGVPGWVKVFVITALGLAYSWLW